SIVSAPGPSYIYAPSLHDALPILRQLLRRLPAVGVSVPAFLGGLLLIQLFAFTLAWLPSGGNRGPASLVLPALTLAIPAAAVLRSEEHTSELQSRFDLVCRLLLEK